MTTHDVEPERDRALDVLLDAASEQSELDAGPRPSFAAVLARARRIDPRLVPPPTPARPTRSFAEDERLRVVLSPFVEAARAEAEFDVALELRAPRPGLPRRRNGPARLVAVVTVLAAAAAVVLALGLFEARRATQVGERSDDSQAAAQVDAADPLHAIEAAAEGPKPRSRGVHRLREDPAVEPSLDADELVILPEPWPEPEAEVDLDPAAGPRRGLRPDALRKLDEDAAARLAAGDSAGAEALYLRLVRQGGRSGLVELAYGDLFTLVHRRGDQRLQVRLWNEYLGKFPRGRFADDARAGLCRSAAADARASCWQRYLDDFPGGAYHRQAARALSPD